MWPGNQDAAAAAAVAAAGVAARVDAIFEGRGWRREGEREEEEERLSLLARVSAWRHARVKRERQKRE
jgi:hypothetical protein